MAYENEDEINEAFFKASRDGRNVNNELLKELQEVYRKAKAFDQIVEIYSDNDHYSDEYVMETIQEQIDLKERADDER